MKGWCGHFGGTNCIMKYENHAESGDLLELHKPNENLSDKVYKKHTEFYWIFVSFEGNSLLILN